MLTRKRPGCNISQKNDFVKSVCKINAWFHKKTCGGAGRVHACVERIPTGGAARCARAFCLRKTKSGKIIFFKSRLSSIEKIEETNVSLLLRDSCIKNEYNGVFSQSAAEIGLAFLPMEYILLSVIIFRAG
ncbi:MAG: hypothetical protein IJY46_07235 [Lentisphaeria bacterium]|nr:hypothetical protein [Lentisphaeria bacterium]